MSTLSQDWIVMPHERVRTRVQERVAWIVMDHPPANNYSYEMMRDLDEAVLAARFDDSVDCLVLTGAGDRFFSSGADIGMLDEATPRWKYAFCLHANETLLRLEHTPKLTIAALNGHCVGGGYEIALACDLRLARRAADGGKPFRIGLSEVALGVLPGTGGTQRLTRLLGRSAALRHMIEAELAAPEEALEAGLVDHLLDFEGFPEAVQEHADRYCAPGKAAMAVGHVKRAVHGGADLALESGLGLERELQQRLFESADAREGIRAFVERRPPRFEGR